MKNKKLTPRGRWKVNKRTVILCCKVIVLILLLIKFPGDGDPYQGEKTSPRLQNLIEQIGHF
jgi:hypothetical protein